MPCWATIVNGGVMGVPNYLSAMAGLNHGWDIQNYLPDALCNVQL